MSWLNKLLPSRINTNGSRRRTVPEGVWTKCTSCNSVLYRAELVRNMEVCPKCGHHMLIHARPRLENFLDDKNNDKARRIRINSLPVLSFAAVVVGLIVIFYRW